MNRRRGAVLEPHPPADSPPPEDIGDGYRVERQTPRLAYGVVHAHVLYDPRLSFAAKTLYSILCAHATTGDRTAWPGTERLASLMGCSDRTRWLAQQELVRAGYLKVVRIVDRGLKRGNLYTLTDDVAHENFPQPRHPRPEPDDMSQGPEPDDMSQPSRPEPDDMSQGPEPDDMSQPPQAQRHEPEFKSDPNQSSGHSDLNQTTALEQTSKRTTPRSGVSLRSGSPGLTADELAMQQRKTSEAERELSRPHCPHGYPIHDPIFTNTAAHACALCRRGGIHGS